MTDYSQTMTAPRYDQQLGGARGASSYESWLRAGNVGTEADFVEWLRNGEDAAIAELQAARSIDAPQAIRAELGIVNIFDKSQAAMNQTVADGATTTAANAGFFATPFLPVIPGDHITFNAPGITAFGGFGVQFCDLSEAFISTAPAVAADTPIPVPSTAHFCRTSFSLADVKPSALMAVHGSTMPASYRGFGVPTVKEIQDLIYPVANYPARNLFIEADAAPDTQLAYSTGATSAVADWFTSDFMPVRPGKIYTVYPAGALQHGGAAFYDRDEVYVSGADPAGLVGATQIAIPTGCFLMRTSGFTASDMSALVVVEGTPASPTRSTTTVAMLSDIAGQLAGQRMKFNGDSLTAFGDPHAYGVHWLEGSAAFHAFSVTNWAEGGRASSQLLLNASGGALTADDFADATITGQCSGTNDAKGSIPVGDVGDATGAGTYCGNLRNFYETAYSYKKQQRFFICTPPKLLAANIDDYADAARAFGNAYGFPILDFHRLSGISAMNFADALGDDTHPNALYRTSGMLNVAIEFFKTLAPFDAII